MKMTPRMTKRRLSLGVSFVLKAEKQACCQRSFARGSSSHLPSCPGYGGIWLEEANSFPPSFGTRQQVDTPSSRAWPQAVSFQASGPWAPWIAPCFPVSLRGRDRQGRGPQGKATPSPCPVALLSQEASRRVPCADEDVQVLLFVNFLQVDPELLQGAGGHSAV